MSLAHVLCGPAAATGGWLATSSRPQDRQDSKRQAPPTGTGRGPCMAEAGSTERHWPVRALAGTAQFVVSTASGQCSRRKAAARMNKLVAFQFPVSSFQFPVSSFSSHLCGHGLVLGRCVQASRLAPVASPHCSFVRQGCVPDNGLQR
jgi:hypothetical protein